ncbi:MAG: DUF1015 domain-containing protein [Christensenellales bacterium]
MDKTQQAGIYFPQILIPEKKVNKQKWSVIACDQFTSNEDFWIKTQRIVGGAPSTFHIIVPEAYIDMQDVPERIAHAKQTMRNYIEDGVLVCLPEGVILTERETPNGTRVGLVLAIDLEQYDTDFTKMPLIRASEETVSERIPIRVALRQDAVIECPHAVLLINDPADTVLGPVYEAKERLAKIYSTSLMQDGGHIEGWFVEDKDILEGLTDSLIALERKAKDNMLFAVGDGNHSLASAKQIWETKKASMDNEELETSPLRYALVEVVNLYDHGVNVYPIHRVLFNVDVPGALRSLVGILNKTGQEAHMMYTRGTKGNAKPGTQAIRFESKMSKGYIEIGKPRHELVIKTLTDALDKLCKEMPRAKVDYIHGDDEFRTLAQEHASLGFVMEPVAKENLFNMVIKYGVLPRKSFSLGAAMEKRYYYECRLLVDADNAGDEDQGGEQAEHEGIAGESEQRYDRPEEEQYVQPEYIEDDETKFVEQEDTSGSRARRGRREKKARRKRDKE